MYSMKWMFVNLVDMEEAAVVKEQLEILRRIAERGQAMALQKTRLPNEAFVDIFQHLLNEILITKKAYNGEKENHQKESHQNGG